MGNQNERRNEVQRKRSSAELTSRRALALRSSIQHNSKLYRLKDLPFNKGYFWSYDFDKATLPLSVIVSQVIENGSIESLIDLINIFDKKEVFDIYNEILKPAYLKSNWLDEKNIVAFMDVFFDAALN